MKPVRHASSTGERLRVKLSENPSSVSSFALLTANCMSRVDRTSAHRKQHPVFDDPLPCDDLTEFKAELLRSRYAACRHIAVVCCPLVGFGWLGASRLPTIFFFRKVVDNINYELSSNSLSEERCMDALEFTKRCATTLHWHVLIAFCKPELLFSAATTWTDARQCCKSARPH